MTALPSVMLVDDVAAERRLLRVALERTGRFRVVAEAGDGRQAVDVAGAVAPDVILLDLSMPTMDGLEALPLLRAAAPQAKVVVLSGFSAEQNAATAAARGAHGYLEKGVHPQRMADHLTALLGGPVADDVPAVDRASFTAVLEAASSELLVEPQALTGEILDALHEGVLVQDVHGVVRASNRSAERMLGVSGDRVTGCPATAAGWRAVDTLGAPLPADRHPAMLALTTGEAQVGVTIGVDDDGGRRRWLLVNAVPLRNGTAAPYAVVSSFIDVTGAREAQQAAGRLSAVVEASSDAIETVTLDGIITSWNSGAEDLYGYSAAEVVGRNKHMLAPPDRAAEIDRALAAIASGERVPAFETVRVRKDGSTIDVSVALSPLRDASGRLIGSATIARDISERRRLEAALRDNELHFRLLAENATDIISRHSPDGTFLYASPACREVLGYDPSELVGTSVFDHVHPDDLAAIESTRPATDDLPDVFGLEYRLRRADGSYVWVETTARTSRVDGTVAEIQCATRDVTRRKEVEEQLRQSDERFRLVQEHSAIGLAVVALDGTWLDVNPALCRVLGRTKEELVGLTFRDVTHPDDQNPFFGPGGGLVCGQITECESERRFVHRDGQVVWAQVNATVVRASDGDPRYLVAQVQDITERKRSQRLLDLVFRASPDLLCIADFDGYFTRVNPSWTETLGWTEEQLRTTPFVEFVHPDDRDGTSDEFEELVGRRGRSDQFENRYRTADGEYRWLQWNSITVHDEGVVVANARDMTAHKHQAAELDRQRAELARSNAELEQFAYVASHDLSEPLRIITGFVHLLKADFDELVDDQAKEYFGYIVEGTGRMQSLIDDLLAYSRVGHAASERERTDLRAVVDDVVSFLAPAIRDAGASVTVGALPVVDAHPAQMRQLFQNLVSNGLKFRSPDRVPALAVGAAPTDDGGWAVTVDDNGIGIDPRHRDRVFKMFQRLHSSSEFPGTGIGLAICRKIVEHHGGAIDVDDSPLGGTRFRVQLPAVAVSSR